MAIGAIDLGGTKTITAILSDSGDILCSRHFPTESKDWKVHFDLITRQFKDCQKEFAEKYPNEVLLGVGINVPGMADSHNGVLMYAPHQNWRDIQVRDYFRKSLSIEEVFIENDVNACAVGEMVFGNGGSDFLWLTISTGNGGALVANSQLVRGFGNCAGEIGHMKVEYEHPRLCACGQRGCLESESSGTAIAEIFNEEILRNKLFQNEVLKFEEVNPSFKRDAAGLAQLAVSGNSTALEIYKQVGKYLGRAISYGLNLSNPEKVYLGGGIAKSMNLFLDEIKNEIEKNVVPAARTVEILETKLGYHAALLGAAALVKINTKRYHS